MKLNMLTITVENFLFHFEGRTQIEGYENRALKRIFGSKMDEMLCGSG
jgi:hypothetical protein